MKMIATLFVVFAVAASALGECPVPPTVPGADIGKIAGRWYETTDAFSHNSTFITFDFTPREDGDFNLTIHAPFSKHDEYVLAKRTDNQNVLNFIDVYHKTRYQVTFNIADTDYDNYLVAYTCLVYSSHSALDLPMILSRTKTMSAEKYAKLSDLVDNEIGVSRDKIEPVIH
ncbi:apolipoprotein D-like [Tetranychus urticae]|uniref:Lipocalin/cytosolic fatty-acid binding domain-containing protein n=1 Tax=Tetranychus urticae TaxID=32264 RepID=T1K842_TETUR|nr:apolipoprotein D-like [Tetranychus urticae]